MKAGLEPKAFAAAESGGVVPLEQPRHAVYLFPGQIFVSAKPARITTILGSCIAVCLYDRSRRIGGMNHFMLPQHAAGSGVSSPRFGDVAMAELFEKLAAAGARVPFLQARIYGGSCMFGPASAGHLGQQNERLAREALAARGIAVVDSDTGGARGRKLIFHTDEGTAWLNSI